MQYWWIFSRTEYGVSDLTPQYLLVIFSSYRAINTFRLRYKHQKGNSSGDAPDLYSAVCKFKPRPKLLLGFLSVFLSHSRLVFPNQSSK